MVGAKLKHMPWCSKKPSWDHDHCEFCSVKITSLNIPDALQEGYATPDLYHWVCPQCFEDFREEFQWL